MTRTILYALPALLLALMPVAARAQSPRPSEMPAAEPAASAEDVEPSNEGGETDAEEEQMPVYEGAHIAFEGNVWDFGDVSRRGGDVFKDFEFVNDGSEPLVITSVTVSCTCIKASWSKRPVEVGGRGTVRLIYEPHKMAAGTFYKVVEVHSNSVGGTCLLTVHGNAVDNRRQ